MPDDPSSPGPTADDSASTQSEGKQDESERMKSRTAIVVAALGAGGAVLAAVIGGIFLLLNSSPTRPEAGSSKSPSASNPACSGFPAEVDVPSSVGSRTTLTFHFNCPPAAGHQYLWVVEADGIGSDKHAEYYPKQFDSMVHAGATVTYGLDLQKDSIGEQNCIYVISPTAVQFQVLENSLNPRNFTLHLPDSIDRVSKPACETRQY